MRNFLAFLGAAIVAFLGVGYYLGWYKIDREPSTPGHSRLQVDIDQDKIGKDVKNGADKVKSAIDKNTTSDPAPAADTKPISGINPAAPFAPTDPKSVTLQDGKKKVAEGVADLITDGWFSAPDKK
jgi:hypothetical protein